MPSELPKVILKKGKEAPLLRKHCWVFSGAVHQMKGHIADGDIVQVLDHLGHNLGTGYYQKGSIRVRMLSFDAVQIDAAFWLSVLGSALKLRTQLGFLENADNNAFRMVNGEGDGLPGLILDYYNGHIVFQAHTSGIWKQRDLISEALKSLFGKKLISIYDKSKGLGRDQEKSIFGNATFARIRENGLLFDVDFGKGQKTGFFLDQRDNRKLLGAYANGKKVLNAFCYTGGFSAYALQGGATIVHSVDSSEPAIEMAGQNMRLNQLQGDHDEICMDVMKFLSDSPGDYNLIILDPPAFAKNLSAKHHAVQGYKRLNALGISKLLPGSILFTFSCSQVIDRQLFRNTIVAAGLEAGRSVRILQELGQPADHPVNLFHPEGSYLKGLVLYVD